MDTRLRVLFGFQAYDPEERISKEKAEKQFYDALGAIEPNERRVIEMHYRGVGEKGEERTYSVKEISEEMGLAEKEVHELRRSGLHKMVDAMAEEFE